MRKKIALLHRYPEGMIKETNAAFPYLKAHGVDVLTFKKFNRLSSTGKFWKSILWIFYAPLLVWGEYYDVIYCDDSYPFYPALVKLVSRRSRVVIRIGDLHLMYYYSGFLYKFLHFFEQITWSVVDEVIAISEEMAFYIRKEVGRHPEIVLDPVDPGDFPILKKELSRKIVMFHGVLTKNKNVDIFLAAARFIPGADFWVVGDGPDKDRLMSLAPDNVKFFGWRPHKEIHKFIASCDIGVALRSDNPGNNYVVTSPFLQYGVMGKPCLVTRRDVFGEYPWQFSGISEMVEKLRLLLTMPNEGEILRHFILKNHDAKEKAEEIWEILTRV